MVDTFDDFKKWLVNECGFGGTLLLQRQKKVNLKFSAWIMSKVNLEAREIDLGGSMKLPFWDADVHKVFAVPYGPREVREPGKQLTTDAVQFIRNALGMDSADNAHSLKAAEAFLMKDINTNSSQMEQDCFKIAYVIFVMGHVLAPGTKHDYSSIDCWYAIGSAENIPEYNWCGYILEELMRAVAKLKNDISTKCSTAHLAACHIFFQIFYLDNMDLGGLNKKHDNIPRVVKFTYGTIKRMIIMATSVGKGDISYTGALFRRAAQVAYTRSQHEVPGGAGAAHMYMQNFPDNSDQVKEQTPRATPYIPIAPLQQRSAISLLGALDFSRHLNSAHPNLPPDGLALPLKEFMARQVLNANNLRNTQITDMVNFADKLIAKMAAKCMCCTARGFDTCILTEPKKDNAQTKIQGRRLDLDAEQGEYSEVPSNIRKRMSDCIDNIDKSYRIKAPSNRAATPQEQTHGKAADQVTPAAYNHKSNSFSITPNQVNAQLNPPTKCPLQELLSRAAFIAEAVRSIYEDADSSAGLVIFGEHLTHNHEKVETPVDIPWADNWLPSPEKFFELKSPGYAKLYAYISQLTADEAARPWIKHEYPRFINIPGIIIRKQLVGNHPLDHELCSAIIRRLNQIVKAEAKKLRIHPWCLSLEPDFAIAALADMHCPTLAHIRNQFVTKENNTHACWLFHAPTLLQDGWCNLAFKMPNKTIYIMDPTAGSRGLSASRKKKLEFVADKVHKARFECINTFFMDWPVDEHDWSKKFPILMDRHYNRDESGVCTTFFVKNFGGRVMKLGVSKDNLNHHRQMLLHQVMQIKGNSSSLPHDHLDASNIDELSPSG